MISELIPFLTASVLLTISPGPDIIYVLIQSLTNGKKAGLLTTLGLSSGIVVHTCLVAFGVSAIIKESDSLFSLVKIAGSLYMFYLAYKIVGADAVISIDSNPASKRNSALIRQGFLMNVLNPKVALFFLAFFPGFLWDPVSNIQYQFFFLGILFMFQTLIIFSMVALLAGKIAIHLKDNPALGTVLKWIQVIVFIGIGIFILI